MYRQNVNIQSQISSQSVNNEAFFNNPCSNPNFSNAVPISPGSMSLSSSTNNSDPATKNSSNLIPFAKTTHNLVPFPSPSFVPIYPTLPFPFQPPVVRNIAPVSTTVITNTASFSEEVLHSVENEKELKLSEFFNKFLTIDKKEKFTLAIPDFRSALKTGFLISKELMKRKHKLNSLLQSSNDTWNSEMKEIYDLKDQLSEICNLIISIMKSGCITKKLKKIRRKREQMKKTKLNAVSAKVKAEQEREEINQEIDKWLDHIEEKNNKQKREAEMKKEADYILLEVRRKIHEGKRTIEKIKVFEKLRNARHASAIQKGLHILPEHNKNFEKKVTILKKLMSRQLVDYEAEEKALKVMLETEQEGQLEEEAQWKLRKIKRLQQRKKKQIHECLFGNKDDPSPSDPLNLFYKHHTSANDSIENLAKIRQQWDVHLAKDGESVPHQWIVPVSDCQASWKQYLS